MGIDWTRVSTHLISVTVAYVLALPVGWDREKEVRSAELRTFPLVAVASCGYMLVAMSILGSGADSIWNTGAISAAAAFERYEIAIVLSVIDFATLRLLTPLKQSVKS